MQVDKEVLFIADLHLSEKNVELNRLFKFFLSAHAVNAKQLYILGDFFDFWLGDDVMSDWHLSIAKLLNKLSQTGTEVFLMVGNRDFLLGKRFAQEANCQLIDDPCVIQLGDKKVLLKHGDDLCTLDKRHQIFRRFSRSRLIKLFFLSLPKSLRLKIAEKIRRISYQSNQQQERRVLDVVGTEVIARLQQYGCDAIIHGHTHNPQIHWVNDKNSVKLHCVLSDWYDKSSCLCYHLTKGFHFNQIRQG